VRVDLKANPRQIAMMLRGQSESGGACHEACPSGTPIEKLVDKVSQRLEKADKVVPPESLCPGSESIEPVAAIREFFLEPKRLGGVPCAVEDNTDLLARPTTATRTEFSLPSFFETALIFFRSWNALIFFLFVFNRKTSIASPGLRIFTRRWTIEVLPLSAAALITAIPTILLYEVLNRRIISGLLQVH